MKFKSYSIDTFIAKRVAEHPETKPAQLRERLASALKDYRSGVRCACGNDLWVIGSALGGNGCFTCITGELTGTDVPELEEALKKRKLKDGRRHISEMDPSEIHGIFDDDGYEVKPESVTRPALCMLCKFNRDPNEETLCNLLRFDQRNSSDFECSRYRRG